MKIWRRVLSAVLVVVLAFSVVSCGGKTSKGEQVETEKSNIKSSAAEIKDFNVNTALNSETAVVLDKKTATAEFLSADGKVTFKVNAVVDGAGVSELPVLSMVPADFSADELQKITEVLANGSDVSGYHEIMPKYLIEEMLEEKKAYIADYDALMEYYSYNEETVEYRIEVVSEEIAQLEADLADAPDEIPVFEPEYIYKPDSEYDEGKDYIRGYYLDNAESFKALTTINGSMKEIYVNKRTGDTPSNDIWLMDDYRYGEEYQRLRWKCYQTEPFTDEEIAEAKKDVLNRLSEMGLDGWVIQSCTMYETSLDEFYEGKDTHGSTDISGMRYDLDIRLVPGYDGVEQLSDTWDYRNPGIYNDQYYDKSYEPPYVWVKYSSGEITEMYAVGLSETEYITEKQTLLSFDDAMQAVYDNLAATWNEELVKKHCDFFNYYYHPSLDEYIYQPITDVENATAYKFEIDEIKLVYVKTESADNPDGFKIIPVWAVYGEGFVTEYNIDNSVVSTKADFPVAGQGTPILLVNAIDGSKVMLDNQY